MQFLSPAECKEWSKGLGIPPGREFPEISTSGNYCFGRLDNSYGQAFLLSQVVGSARQTLLWVTMTDVGQPNLQLYYRFRESYGDRRLVDDAPGHLFLHYEQEDFLSFLQIGIWNGWDMFAFTDLDYGRLFISHDGFYHGNLGETDHASLLVRIAGRAPTRPMIQSTGMEP